MPCPHCGKVPYPIKNKDGSVNWKNAFKIDILSLLFFVSVILLLLGHAQITADCRAIVEHTDIYCAPYCEMPINYKPIVPIGEEGFEIEIGE